MSEIIIADVVKMKVTDLRKELKLRGLPSTGEKAVLVERLQTALTQDAQDDHGDINLDSDEIDSDGVLDEDDKSNHDLLEDTAVDLNEELALTEQSEQTEPTETPVKSDDSKVKPQRTLKRKITSDSSKDTASDGKGEENKEAIPKKIVLNRATSITSSTVPVEQKTEEKTIDDKTISTTVDSELASDKVKITADLDAKSKLELRAKRFGLPIKASDEDRKEARKLRFGQNAASVSSSPITDSDNLEKLKKRAERFGTSVSKFMTNIDNKDKLEKRKIKFGINN